MAYQTVAIRVTLMYSFTASLSKCFFSYSRAAVDKLFTDMHRAIPVR